MTQEKINIAELLKDCPKGMELYSPLCGKCVFDSLNMGTIICKKQNTQEIAFTSRGYYMLPIFDDCECMIFPSKDQRDWSKFHRPFKDGDIVALGFDETTQIFIFKEYIRAKNNYARCYMMLDNDGGIDFEDGSYYVSRFATEEEKEKLFKAIKDNGYKWNAETKTLEKLIQPKFKVGDRVTRTATHEIHIIGHITSTGYVSKNEGGIGFIFENEHLYELAPDKFDITTLKPFESRVLVRDAADELWEPAFFGYFKDAHKYPTFSIVGGSYWKQCIPYEGNEHLLGKTDDCDEFYKTWE